jgi:hypothetical protein
MKSSLAQPLVDMPPTHLDSHKRRSACEPRATRALGERCNEQHSASWLVRED